MAPRQHTERDARIASLRAQGVPVLELAERFALSPSRIHDILEVEGVSLRKRRKPVEVPSWVPASLVAAYQSHAADYGEEEAAMLVRRLKRSVA